MNLIMWTLFNMTESNNLTGKVEPIRLDLETRTYISCLLNIFFILEETTKVRES